METTAATLNLGTTTRAEPSASSDTQPGTHPRFTYRQSTRSAVTAWLKKALVPVFKPTRTLLAPTMRQAFLMRPFVFEAWYRARAWRLLLTHGMKSVDEAGHVMPQRVFGQTKEYNLSKMWEWHRTRTEKLMAVLRCIQSIPPNAKVLVIGPRNEAEMLLLHLYGFSLGDQTGVDLFSYSPQIQCMDMHDLKFQDSTFDIVYSAWTLKYSHDVQKACAEIVRVAKPGGVVATGFAHTSEPSYLDASFIEGGLSELHRLFEPHVAWVYWQEVLSVGESEAISTIFRIRK